MILTVLCSDKNHPILDSLKKWVDLMQSQGHQTEIVFDRDALSSGDILFLVSCSQIIRKEERSKFKSVLVLHASDLPEGRGWSPSVWAIINGANKITVSLLEAEDSVDSGAIWLKTSFELEGHELLPEINKLLFAAEISLMTDAVNNFSKIIPIKQLGDVGTYLRRRTPDDSMLDPDKTIAEQFDLLRVADSQRYPAFFNYRGKRYLVNIEKAENEE